MAAVPRASPDQPVSEGPGARAPLWDIRGHALRRASLVPYGARVAVRHADVFPSVGMLENHASIYEKAWHGISFLRRYHGGIDVPPDVVAHALLEDAEKQLQQTAEGDGLVGCTTTLARDERGALCIVSVGGRRRCDLRTWRG